MTLPAGVSPETAKKIQKIYSSGRMTIGDIAKRIGWSERRVRACLPDEDVRRGYPAARRKPEHTEKVNAMWRDGLNQNQMAAELGVSRQAMSLKMKRIREWNAANGVENGPHPQN